MLRLTGITRSFGDVVANDNISLALARGEIVGLLGENGAGKTTLMNILFGHYVADAGSVEVDGRLLPPGSPAAALAAGIGMVHQHFTLADNLTALDNIILGTESMWRLRSGRGRARRRILSLAREFGLAVEPDTLVASLSVGQRQRVEILKALYRGARILILDEPTAVLTPQESDALFSSLRRFAERGLSIIFISHKLGEVLASCHRVAVLRAGRMVAERKLPGVSRAELAELMVGRVVASPKATPQSPGPVLLSLSGVSARSGGQRIDDVSLELCGGEILGVAGVSGNGQAALCDAVCGVAPPDSGRIAVRGKAIGRPSPRDMLARGLGRIPEDRHAEGMVVDMSVAENAVLERIGTARFSRFGVIDWPAARRFAEGIVERFAVKCPSLDAPTRLLSGGNMQKLMLGRALADKPAILIANQPTRGLDVGAIAFVHQQLLDARGSGAAVLLISEDLDELLALSDRICVAYRGRLSQSLPRAGVSIAELGLRMAGQGFEAGAKNAA